MPRLTSTLIFLTVLLPILPAQPPTSTHSLDSLGKVYYSRGDYPQARDAFAQALEIQQATLPPDDDNLRKTAGNLGLTHYRLGDYQEAARSYELAIAIRMKQGRAPDATLVKYYTNLGNAYFQLGFFQEARNYYLELERTSLEMAGSDPNLKSWVAVAWNNLASYHLELGDYHLAENYLQKAQEVWSEVGAAGNLALLQYNLGELNRKKYDLDRALIHYREAYRRWEASDEPDKLYRMINCLERIGVALRRRPGGFEPGLDTMRLGLELRAEYLPTHPETGHAYHNLAVILRKAGQLDEASLYLQKSLEWRLDRNPIDSVGLADYYVERGHLAIGFNEIDQAAAFFAQGLELRRRLLPPGAIRTGQAYNYLANVRHAQGRYDESLTLAEEAVRQLTAFAPAPLQDISELRHSQSIAAGLYRQATCLLARESGDKPADREKALRNIQLASRLIDRLRYDHYDFEDKIETLEASRPIFEAGIEACLQLYEQEADDWYLQEAFRFSEKGRAAILYEDWLKKEAHLANPTFAEIRREEARFQQRIAQLENRLFAETDQSQEVTERLERDYQQLKLNYFNWIDSIEQALPAYHAAAFQEEVVSPEALRQAGLLDDRTLLQYFIGEQSAYAFVLTRDTLVVRQLPERPDYHRLVDELNRGIYDFYSGSTDDSDEAYDRLLLQYTDNARKLYRNLIEPVRPLLRGSLVIVPDGPLGLLPFEALLAAKPEEEYDFWDYPYLLKDFPVSYNYSATIWKAINSKRPSTAGKSLLAMAPFFPDGKPDTSPYDARLQNKKKLAPLPYSGEEVRHAVKIWGGDYLLGDEAKATYFLQRAGHYRMLHLSTHAQDHREIGENSRIYFSGGECLYLRDIYNLHINADLVVLSACETASGELEDAEGVISLARAFTYAGAKSLVTTLWRAEDLTTAPIVKAFHEALRDGTAVDLALQQARLQYLDPKLEDRTHPYYWIGFIAMGDTGALSP